MFASDHSNNCLADAFVLQGKGPDKPFVAGANFLRLQWLKCAGKRGNRQLCARSTARRSALIFWHDKATSNSAIIVWRSCESRCRYPEHRVPFRRGQYAARQRSRGGRSEAVPHEESGRGLRAALLGNLRAVAHRTRIRRLSGRAAAVSHRAAARSASCWPCRTS